MYANDHQGDWPTKIDDLAPTYIKQDMLQTPFIYLRPAKQAKNIQNIVVLYEKPDAKRPQIAVGFLDGHAELVKQDQFKANFDQTTGMMKR